jgi:broad specificity phosphatase PhoE
MTSIADRVFLARHGRTALNAEGRLRGLSDPPLDEVGIAEVARLAEALAPKHPTAVICSPLQRAVATAQAIGSASGAPVTVDARLNDRDHGPMTGHLRDEVEREYGSVDRAPGVEPLTAVAARARQAFLELAADYGPGTACHGVS